MRGIGRSFLKGFLIGVLCLCIVGLAGLFVLRPSLTAAEADALKRTYSEAGPGADRSGALPAGEEPASFVDFSSLRADYPDVKGWLTIPAQWWITLCCKAVPRSRNTTCGAIIGVNGGWRAVCFFSTTARCRAKTR